jgi:hypothetical protein
MYAPAGIGLDWLLHPQCILSQCDKNEEARDAASPRPPPRPAPCRLLSVLRMSRMFPDGLFLEQSVRSGRDELVYETDYVREADNMDRFRCPPRPPSPPPHPS